jgi:hypothetical protein
MTRTVSVELTEDDLLLVLMNRYPDAHALEVKLREAQLQLHKDTDREAKVQALDNATYHTAIPEGNRPVPTVILKHLNAAGWDLVRMEDT